MDLYTHTATAQVLKHKARQLRTRHTGHAPGDTAQAGGRAHFRAGQHASALALVQPDQQVSCLRGSHGMACAPEGDCTGVGYRLGRPSALTSPLQLCLDHLVDVLQRVTHQGHVCRDPVEVQARTLRRRLHGEMCSWRGALLCVILCRTEHLWIRIPCIALIP